MSSPLSQLRPVSSTPANAAIPRYSVWTNQIRGLERTWPSNLTLALMKISDEVRLFEQAFSPMAKRNVAMSMHTRIAEFEKAWKAAYRLVPLPRQLVDLREAARKQADMIVSGNKYDYVSCIGYGVKTGKFDEHMFKAQWTGSGWNYNGLVQYTGGSSDNVDSLAKCHTMRQAIEVAYARYQTAHGSDPNDARTLKVFMAPEFYFRGRQGAYDVSRVSGIFTELRRFTRDSRFKDWLFVFGTVIGASFDDRLFCRSCGKVGAGHFRRTGPNQYACTGCPPNSVIEGRLGARIDNVALIQKGGEKDFKNAHVIEKEYVSHIDFRRHASPQAMMKGKAYTGFDNVAILDNWSANRGIDIRGTNAQALAPLGSRDFGGEGGSKFQDERMGGSIFTVDGIKFGLEICLDHLNGRIAPGSGIQIQLVPSAGAHLKQLTCVPDGIGFNVDGLAANCDAQVNASNGPTRLTPTSTAAPGGGEIKIFAPQAIPY